MAIRSTAATQDAQVCRVQWAGSVISGYCPASQRPILASTTRYMPRVTGARVDVACQRSTQPAQASAAPVITAGPSPYFGAAGGSA
jgi:hypothetical protein